MSQTLENGQENDYLELRTALNSSSTNKRIQTLKLLRQDLSNHTTTFQGLQSISKILFATFPRYNDRPSRRAIQDCLRAIFSDPDNGLKCLQSFSRALTEEAKRSRIAPSNALVLLEWCSTILQLYPKLSGAFDLSFGLIVQATAAALEECLADNAKPSLRHAAIITTRRGLRSVLKDAALNEKATAQAISELARKTSNPTNSCLLGVIAGVSARLPAQKPCLRRYNGDLISFYKREIIGSKTPVPNHVAHGMNDFFSSFLSNDEITQDLLPSFEKAILRSPEIVLSGLIGPLVQSLPASIDLAETISKSLLQPLLSSLKSTNSATREGSLNAFKGLIQKSHNEGWQCQIAKDIVTALKGLKAMQADAKSSFGRLLSFLPMQLKVSTEILSSTVQVTSKETNEGVIEVLASAICRHLSTMLRDDVLIDKPVCDLVLNGCKDRKPHLRKVWILKLGRTLWSCDLSAASTSRNEKFVESALKQMQINFNDILANPMPALSSGLIASGYVPIALFGSKLPDGHSISANSSSILQSSLTISPKPSFLLNPRVYTKIMEEEELLWVVRAMASAAPYLTDVHSQAKLAWTDGILYLLGSPDIPAQIRQTMGSAMVEVYMSSPLLLGRIMVSGMWHSLEHTVDSVQESAGNTASSTDLGLHAAIQCVCPRKDAWLKHGLDFPKSALKDQLISMLVFCRPSLISRADWIGLVLKVGLDPGDLVRERVEECMSLVREPFERSSITALLQSVRTAACSAAAQLAFIAPDEVLPLLITQFQGDLDPMNIRDLGHTEVMIAESPPDVTFINVLSTKSQSAVADKGSKDYDTRKWEAEIRAQIAQKRGTQQKLTAEEKAKVEEQLAKEALIRLKVRNAQSVLSRGSGIIYQLAIGPPTPAIVWVNHAISTLLDAIRADADLFVDGTTSGAYLSLSDLCSLRLDGLRRFVGVAVLRAIGHSKLPSGYEEEDLGNLVTRVLYRLRFAAEQRPFDDVTLSYILPLLFHVLSHGSIGNSSSEDADAQVLLALEFFSFQTEAGSNKQLPRSEILSYWIQALQKYSQHHRLIKDTLLSLFKAISSEIRSAELTAILRGTTVADPNVRNSLLQLIQAEVDLTDLDYSKEIWLCCHDSREDNAELADIIWEENGLEINEALANDIQVYLGDPDRSVREAAARALGHCVEEYPAIFPDVLKALEQKYKEKAKLPIPERDKYGMVKKIEVTDDWQTRSGTASGFKALSSAFRSDMIKSFMEFLIAGGPLVDRSSNVRSEMVEAGMTIIASRGHEQLEPLMYLFENALESSDKQSQESDWVSEAVILLYGSLARHLSNGDGRVKVVIGRLLSTLSTPSETVQYAVAGCLPPIIRLVPSEATHLIKQSLEQLYSAQTYAARRGAAYGLAGLVVGTGVSSLHGYRILLSLRSALEDKKSVDRRQGALFAYEILASILGRTFEPYILQILPQLLGAFGDPNASVRDACLDTAKALFAHLSSYGVRKVLPQLLEGLQESQWRSKKGACDLLGAMAYLDPQQLANSLPTIIPPLAGVLNDSHKEVRTSANRSLQRFGDVLSNPEVKGLVGVLLNALSDPTKYTDEALDSLIKVSFTHYLDAPSLALVVRILERGLSDRSTTKRKAAQIIGSLAHLTDRRDLLSHLPILVAGLRLASVDPVPATRATASKALGSLVEKLGEDAMPDLIPSLMGNLKSDSGAGDRLGSAQALSEVLAGLGTSRLEETLPTVLQNVSSPKATVREGFMTLFIFLPACFGNSFANYLNKIIPPILTGLADDIEAIRDISLRAGRLLVKNFSSKAIDLLLPELQRGLADDSYRIRLSSVELVGDLLFSLTGISSKTEAEEDDEGAAKAGQSLLEVLGEDKRNKVLSSLYICRCDTSGLVRSAAIAVWKALVATPRTLKEIIPTLTQLIISRLASTNMEQKVIASNALGEVIRKTGEGVLAALLPTLEDELRSSTDQDARQGICIALREVITSASPDALEDYEKTLISVVRTALVDQDGAVREAAAEAFDSLQQSFGKKAIDQVLPHLLHLLQDPEEAENSLSALLTLLHETTRANIILPNLIPTLLKPPITSFNAGALASLAQVAGPTMTRRLPVILNSLVDNVVTEKDPEQKIALNAAFDAVLGHVDEFDGLNTAMSVMLTLMKNDDHLKRAVAASRLATFFSNTAIDFSRYHQDLIRVLLISFDDRDNEVVKAAWMALSQLTSRLHKEEMESLVTSTRQILQQVGVPGVNLPGFSLPKGINAILPIFLQGLINGSQDQRVQAALAISDIVERTEPNALKPSVTQITGPLIRVVSERSVEVKCAILYTLNQLLAKIPTFLRPFLPQLQRTFTKSLADPSSSTLRDRAAKALGTLITMTPRIDPLIAELVTGSKTKDQSVRAAMLKGLHEVVDKAGPNMSDSSKDAILGLIDTQDNEQDDTMAIATARLIGALIKVLPATSASGIVKNRALAVSPNSFSILLVNAVLLDSPASLVKQFINETATTICQGTASSDPSIQGNSLLAAGKVLLTKEATLSSGLLKSIWEALAGSIQPGKPVDTRRIGLVVIRTISRSRKDYTNPFLPIIVSPLFANVREPIIPLKLAAEAAFLELFSVVQEESAVFDAYLAGPGAELPYGSKRAMQDYFKRVALRLGGQARERKEAEGGQGGLGLMADEVDDEKEVWSVGKVDLEASGSMDSFNMVNLRTQKRLASSVVGCGKRKIWLDPNEQNEISNANSRQTIRKLVSDGLIIRKPVTMHSRARARELNAARRIGRHRGFGKRKGTKDARMPSQVLWMRRQRVLRRLLVKYRAAGKIDKHLYHELYHLGKGNTFKHKRALVEHIHKAKAEKQRERILKEEMDAKRAKTKAARERRQERISAKRNALAGGGDEDEKKE
ncbi:MAG: hypothetical protein Q9160_007089 [Pyrenula sp. 1 TL-2023]